METKILEVQDLNKENLKAAMEKSDDIAQAKIDASLEKVDEAAEIIKNGGLVAFPTETVYGLGANALDEKAVGKVYSAKGRPSDNPMIVHIARASDIGQLTPMLSSKIIKLVDSFWPGPLTLVLKKKDNVPNVTTGGLDTVAVRMPDDPIALELIRKSGYPIAAPSANISGRPSPTKASHVIADLDGKIDAVLVGGDCRVGIESTVLDLTVDTPTILRPGIITSEDIQAVIGGKVQMDPALILNRPRDESEPAKAPGMKYTHYAPKAQMTVIEGERGNVKKEIERLKALNERIGLKVGVILFEEKDFVVAAHEFFARLRQLDDENVDLILAGALSDQNEVGFAVMNRMLKSAGYNIARV
ncbi:L-threonylcarbamoyladenylate synthase [Anaerovorax odorimutans]|uniref:L-threonylcarbamoyladenylate synthase n=1 Tax=Anaerovorax odorimutans TaxID=109327 RepID=UPI0003FC5A54|nr:L-threonylcarbamoyladenylate synthase [Anaerovorax odorimutans]